jgi:hypothetical protein
VYEFGWDEGEPSEAEGEVYPLRHYTDCAYMGHHLHTRTLAGTYYVEGPLAEYGFEFREEMLPVSDSLIPWVPNLLDMPAGDERRLFAHSDDLGDRELEMQLERFHVLQPFGEKLAIFSYPPAGHARASSQPSSPRFRLRQAIEQTRAAHPVCAEAQQAAEACCKWPSQ